MGGQSVTVFLLAAALCSEATLLFNPHLTSKATWAEARQHCQAASSDLATWHVLSALKSYAFMKTDVWIGLRRDQEQDSVWKWIDQGTDGEDVSSDDSWAVGQSSRLCAVISRDSYWYSGRCSSRRPFYCWRRKAIYYDPRTLTWDGASAACRNASGYLVTTEWSTQSFPVAGWFGLYRVGGDKWSWVQNVSSSNTNWGGGSGRPAAFDCGSLDPATGRFHSEECATRKTGLCSGDNLLLVNQRKTWEEAVRHCRDMQGVKCGAGAGACGRRYDLVSLSRSYGSDYAKAKIVHAATDEVWVGLRFLEAGWMWLDGAEVDVEAQKLLPGCPSPRQRCGMLSRDKKKTWVIGDCSTRKSFICALIG